MIRALLLNFKRFRNSYINFALFFAMIITFISLSISVVSGYSSYFKNESNSYYHLNYIQLITSNNIKEEIDEKVSSDDYFYYQQKVNKDKVIDSVQVNVSFIPIFNQDVDIEINIGSYSSNIPNHLNSYYKDNNPLFLGRFPSNDKEITLSLDLYELISSQLNLANYSFDDLDSFNFDLISKDKSLQGYKVVGVFSSSYLKLGSDVDILLSDNDSYFENNYDIYNYLFIKDVEKDIEIENALSDYDLTLGYGVRRYKKLLSIQEFINSVLLIIFIPLILGILFLFVHSFSNIYKLNNRVMSIELSSGVNLRKVTSSFTFQIGILLLISLIFGLGLSSILLFVISIILESFEIGLVFNYLFNILVGFLLFLVIFGILIIFTFFLIRFLKEKHISQLLKIS